MATDEVPVTVNNKNTSHNQWLIISLLLVILVTVSLVVVCIFEKRIGGIAIESKPTATITPDKLRTISVPEETKLLSPLPLGSSISEIETIVTIQFKRELDEEAVITIVNDVMKNNGFVLKSESDPDYWVGAKYTDNNDTISYDQKIAALEGTNPVIWQTGNFHFTTENNIAIILTLIDFGEIIDLRRVYTVNLHDMLHPDELQSFYDHNMSIIGFGTDYLSGEDLAFETETSCRVHENNNVLPPNQCDGYIFIYLNDASSYQIEEKLVYSNPLLIND